MSDMLQAKTGLKIPLRVILIVPFIIQIVLIVGWVGYLSFRNGRQAVNAATLHLRDEITTRIEDHLHTFLSTPHQINRLNANALRQKVLTVHDPQALEHHLWEQIQVFDSVTSIYFGNTDGGLADAGREGAEGNLYVIETEGFIRGPFNKYATDSLGNRTNLLTSIPDFDARTRAWYTGAVEKGSANWSEIYILFTGQDMAIAASQPVYDAQGTLLGVCATDIFLSHLQAYLKNIQIGKTGQSFIIERSGLLIASSTDEAPFTDPDGPEPQRRLDASESTIPHIRHAAEFLIDQFGDYHQITTGQKLEFAIEGQRQFMQVTPLQDEYGIDWLVVVIIPESDFMAQIHANNRVTLYFMGLALVIAIGVGIITTQWITQPILRLNASAQILAEGEWSQKVAVGWISETSELTASFNTMAGQLRQTLENLRSEITQRQQTQKELEKERAFTEAALNAQQDTFFVFDPTNNQAIRWNKTFSEISGYTDEEIAARKAPDDWYSDTDLQKAAKAIEEVFREGHAVVEIALITKNQGKIPTEYSIAPIKDQEGKLNYLIAIGRDITERKRAEAALQESHQRLEQTLVELQEMQEKMMQQERLAAVGQLAAGIAHDFNNIMATVVLYAQMTARDKDLPAYVRKRMETINQQAEQATQLIQQILDFGRRAVLARQAIDLQSILNEQCALLARTLPENIEIQFLNDTPGDTLIYADPTRIQQIVTNLAVNARDAMPNGGKLQFKLEYFVFPPHITPPVAEMTPGDWVKMSVSDTGTGIPDDVLPHIFEPFFTTKSPLGSGLGLAQVYGIVAQHQGHITVETQLNHGTTFILYFPMLLPTPVSTINEQNADNSLYLPDLMMGEGAYILLVEDDATVRQALAESLELLNYQVRTAANGEEALEILEAQQSEIALVLSDMVMPDMGGLALFQALRQKALEIPVILLSGHPLETQATQVQGISNWLLKPPSLEQLAQAIADALAP
ncbi:MAG: response regulator [Anaerolineae bacterium]|nr:response regulator [Anaerolineae bacterium]